MESPVVVERRVGAAGNIAGSGRLGFGVGDKAFMDEATEARGQYWRQIEYGSSVHVGAAIGGLWGDRSGPRGALITGEPLSPFGEGAGQKFVPFVNPMDAEVGGRRALHYLNRLDGQRSRRGGTAQAIGGTRGIIQKPIEPEDFFGRAAANWDPLDRERNAIRQAFEQAGSVSFGRGGKTSRNSARNAAFGRANLRGGFLSAYMLSEGTLDVVFDDQVFQAELTKANRLLAHAFATEVASALRKGLVRPGVSSGELADIILDPRNRFPS